MIITLCTIAVSFLLSCWSPLPSLLFYFFLKKNNIIDHCLGSNKRVADIINNLKKGTFIQINHYLAHLYANLMTISKQEGISGMQA